MHKPRCPPGKFERLQTYGQSVPSTANHLGQILKLQVICFSCGTRAVKVLAKYPQSVVGTVHSSLLE